MPKGVSTDGNSTPIRPGDPTVLAGPERSTKWARITGVLRHLAGLGVRVAETPSGASDA
jgi:hypothetical protein